MDQPRHLQTAEQRHQKIEDLKRRTDGRNDRVEGKARRNQDQINHEDDDVTHASKCVMARVDVGIAPEEAKVQKRFPDAAEAPTRKRDELAQARVVDCRRTTNRCGPKPPSEHNRGIQMNGAHRPHHEMILRRDRGR